MDGSGRRESTLGSRDIAQLLAVADRGSIRRAAESLGMTQPGLSKNIRSIEDRLGLAVFERSTQGAAPTEMGTLLLRRGRQILLDLDAIHRDLREDILSETGKVRIGVGPVAAPVVAARVIARCHRKHPGIRIDMDVASPGELIDRLERGDFEFVIASCDGITLPGGVVTRVIQTVNPVFFVRTGHPLAAEDKIPWTELARWKLATAQVTPAFSGWFTKGSRISESDIAFQCDDFEFLGQAVEESDMVSFTSPQVFAQLQRRRDLVALDVADVDFQHNIHMIKPTSRQMSRPSQLVMQMIETAFAEP